MSLPPRTYPSTLPPAESRARLRRRGFLIGMATLGGALALGWTLLPPRPRRAPLKPLPVRQGETALDGWVKVGADGQVTVMLARSEMGQGVSTALAMLLADEMDADWAQVTTEQAPSDPMYRNLATMVDALPFHPGEAGPVKRGAEWMTGKLARELGINATGGSSSIKDLWRPMREAGACARALMVQAAAQRWQVAAGDCRVARGVVRHDASGRSAGFGELAAEAARLPWPKDIQLKTPQQFTLIGQPLARRDAQDKQTGRTRYGLDVLQPEQRFARVVMSPTLGGSVASMEARAALGMPGVQAVVSMPPLRGGTGGVAAVADTPWHAIQAARAIQVQWNPGAAAAFSTVGLKARLADALNHDRGHAFFSRGEVDEGLRAAARHLSAEFYVPLLAHATLEPQNATVLFQPLARRATVWAPTQVPDFAVQAVAEVLGLAAEQVTLHIPPLGGGFGRRLEVDFIAQAAAVARQVPDTPVQTFWSREQDLTHDLYRPPCLARYEAGLDAQGRLLAWKATSAGPSLLQQVAQRHQGLATRLGALGPDKTTAEGAFDQPYGWQAARIAHVNVPLPIQVGYWRSVGHSQHAFFKECFLDEVAQAAGQDPLAFRLTLLAAQPRARAVLQRAADLAGWGQPLPPAADGARKARGLALHASFGSLVAQVAEVSLDPIDPRAIRVHQVHAAIDCGAAVNPNLVKQQVEGAILQGLCAALHGDIAIVNGQVQQTNFHDQPMLRMPEAPRITVDILPSAAAPEGVGEPGLPPIAPAVANALAVLTGERPRSLPLRLG